MEILYKVEGNIFYEESEPEVQQLAANLLKKEKIASNMITEKKGLVDRFGLHFSFYKRAEIGFVSDFLFLLSFGEELDSGEIIIIDPFQGAQQYVVYNGRVVYNGKFVSDNHCS